MFCKFVCLQCLVSEENLQKNISLFSKSVKQMEIDIKNAQQDKSALPTDRFLPVMTISFSAHAHVVMLLQQIKHCNSSYTWDFCICSFYLAYFAYLYSAIVSCCRTMKTYVWFWGFIVI